MHLIDLAGFGAAAVVLVAYALTNSGSRRVRPKVLAGMNLAAGLLAANGVVHQAWPTTALNAVWFVIAVVALGRRSGPSARPTSPCEPSDKAEHWSG